MSTFGESIFNLLISCFNDEEKSYFQTKVYNCNKFQNERLKNTSHILSQLSLTFFSTTLSNFIISKT